MVIEENCNGNGFVNGDRNRVNGFLHGSSSGSGGSSSAGNGSSLRTYKRRKCSMPNSSCKVVDLENMPCATSAQLDEKVPFFSSPCFVFFLYYHLPFDFE